MGEENRLLEELALYEEQCGGLEEQVAELSGRIKNAEFLDENAARSFTENARLTTSRALKILCYF